MQHYFLIQYFDMGSSTQTLNQSVCQKYGWGILYGADEDTGNWVVDVFYAIGKNNRYTAPIPSGEKRGKAVVSEIAFLGLKKGRRIQANYRTERHIPESNYYLRLILPKLLGRILERPSRLRRC
jgi:hypothetical protein